MVSPILKELLEEGTRLKAGILSFLKSWPRDESDNPEYWADTSESHQETAREWMNRVRRWFNSVALVICPLILHDRELLYGALRQVEASIRNHQYSPSRGEDIETRLETACEDANRGMNFALDLIDSVPPAQYQFTYSESVQKHPVSLPAAFQPNTAFILMWMDKQRHDLDDILDAIKSVCASFGIQASRADEIEHEGVITEVVLHRIRASEFLIADLSGERPNVYYEIGYAHAMGKRPILFRHEDVRLHFDLAGHNVPEYQNIRELKLLLRKRLEAMTGKKPLTEEV